MISLCGTRNLEVIHHFSVLITHKVERVTVSGLLPLLCWWHLRLENR